VNQTAARAFWSGANPIGQRVSIDSGAHWFTVVGVVRDVRQHDLTSAVAPFVYAPFFQYPTIAIRLYVQSGLPAGAAEALMRRAVHTVDALQPLTDVRTLESMRTSTLASPQLTTTLSLVFSLVALLLTAAGLTGVMAFSVSQRTRELGIRLALGAERTRVLIMVMREGMIWVVTGLAIGVLAAVVATRLFERLLFGVQATDAPTYSLVITSVVLVTLVACLVPARRATRVDPLTAIRTS
jgi:putative ABC transport system permease protein